MACVSRICRQFLKALHLSPCFHSYLSTIYSPHSNQNHHFKMCIVLSFFPAPTSSMALLSPVIPRSWPLFPTPTCVTLLCLALWAPAALLFPFLRWAEFFSALDAQYAASYVWSMWYSSPTHSLNPSEKSCPQVDLSDTLSPFTPPLPHPNLLPDYSLHTTPCFSFT